MRTLDERFLIGGDTEREVERVSRSLSGRNKGKGEHS